MLQKNKLILLIILLIVIFYNCLSFSFRMHYSKMKNIFNLSFLKDKCFNLYRDNKVLKKILINRFPEKKKYLEPIVNNYLNFLIKLNYMQKAKVPIYTMMDIFLTFDLERHVKNTNKLEGDLVDVGVWQGGSSMIMKYYMNKNKKLYLLDLFDTMDSTSITGNNNKIYENDKIVIEYLRIVSEYFKTPIIKTTINDVKNNFKKKGINLENVYFLKGNLNDKNFPYHKINKISLLRIDCDFYLPTLNVLKNLYHKVVKGGIIIFDDFNLPLLGEKQAALDFFKGHNINFISVSQSAFMIKK